MRRNDRPDRKKWAALLLLAPLAACSGHTGAPAGSVPDTQTPVQTPSDADDAGNETDDGEETNGGAQTNDDGADGTSDTDAEGKTDASVTAGLTGETQTLADNLDTPWEIQFDGDTVYMTLRGGGLVKVENGEQTEQKLNLQQGVSENGEGGLLGLALAPDFADSREAYVYHTYEQGGEPRNRVVRIEQAEDGSGWSETAVLLGDIPGARVHDGGRLAFGPDGMLYVTTGDAQNEQTARDTSSVSGKILRMTPDGKVPADNPIEGSYVYSYGHRNPQGIDWTADGAMYASEHGPSGSPGGRDEMNRIEPGADYGWPDAIGDETAEGATPPLYHTGEQAIAPSGIAATPDGRLLVANLIGESLTEFDPATNEMTEAASGLGRIRDVAVQGGNIYVITNNTDGRGSPGEGDDKLLLLK
ncbi:PQQ-dependent sugar dehydrogenase [Saccharibacillus sp. CPCC 101409]|uniref:PQQ-dependent sugar dehydrogenase n=1 Tax=Saccharibacillus sp. CPCC 101409 TaxID=3058041 RepID=UPI0026722A5E|nr:PQQ-dependent sugar dehydrogenase [Saccharibacillus sp. CPCC 101409]MDO3411076.1 PQQ-dependent sugar dehydrogenase [Saccharibacillus sp. CPCC 101409]